MKLPDVTRSPLRLRRLVQGGFLAFFLLVGFQFHRFAVALDAPESIPLPTRPPAAEAFLPISSLMSLTFLAKSGHASTVHPAGLVIFSLTLLLGLTVRRGFCSWACPIGALSEYAHTLGRWLLGRNLALPTWLDIPLRALKYILLAFFLLVVTRMSADELAYFLDDSYNRIVDVKMYLLFASPTRTTLVVLGVLLALSVLVKNFWCRYLCPYGALAGLLSLLSPVAIRRRSSACTSCGRCTRACPNRLPVSTSSSIHSPECTACYTCVWACPTPGALSMTAGPRRRPIALPALAYALITLAAFLAASQAARALGYWQSSTTPAQYKALNGVIDQIGHPTWPASPRR